MRRPTGRKPEFLSGWTRRTRGSAGGSCDPKHPLRV